MMLTLMTANYKEQVTWRDAATGRIIAESDFFEPLTINSLVTPSFGGRVYFPTGRGFIVLQVMPAPGRKTRVDAEPCSVRPQKDRYDGGTG